MTTPAAESRAEPSADVAVSSDSQHDAEHRRRVRSGIILGLISAVGYSGANLALRDVAKPNDLGWAIWVTANKAWPAAIVGWTLVGLRASRGLPALPPKSALMPLILMGLLMQYGGNLAFQYSLSVSGLAIAVPLCFSTLIATGAWLGRVMLGDPLTPRTLASVGILLVAIVFLTDGAEHATAALHGEASASVIALGVITACLAGCSYGSSGVMIRRYVTGNLSVPTTLVVLSTTGVLVMGTHSLFSPGVDRMAATTAAEWTSIIAAGLLNAIAFFAVAEALKRMPVTFVNVLNTSQNAMCAAAGVLLFAEPLTTPLLLGCSLTMIGLLIVDSGRKQSRRSE
ncbi:MAG: DMT family transporter [Planctomycetota bacterium]|jgi:drug/metabolite transporter (DMT)-like permease